MAEGAESLTKVHVSSDGISHLDDEEEGGLLNIEESDCVSNALNISAVLGKLSDPVGNAGTEATAGENLASEDYEPSEEGDQRGDMHAKSNNDDNDKGSEEEANNKNDDQDDDDADDTDGNDESEDENWLFQEEQEGLNTQLSKEGRAVNGTSLHEQLVQKTASSTINYFVFFL